MIPDHPHPWAMRLLAVAAAVGILGWLFLLGLLGWWTLQPVTLPTIAEPIAVLNPGNEVAIGDTLLMELEVSKPVDLLAVGNSRRLECLSTNLVTLTAGVTQLPAGTYTVRSDSIVLPAKITPGDQCEAVLGVTYQINPIRVERVEWRSEAFTVLPDATATLGGTP